MLTRVFYLSQSVLSQGFPGFLSFLRLEPESLDRVFSSQKAMNVLAYVLVVQPYY
jgi:hypothetical protein